VFPAASAPPLVGRSRELTWLDARLDEALAGKPQVLLITGEAGIGKSRLLRELQRRATARGAEVCPGRCREGRTVPYLPFLRSFLPRLERACREDGDPHGHAELIARLAGRPDQTTGSAEPSPEQEQAWLFFAVAETAIRLARRGTLVITIDDLQWADPPSIDLLYQLVVEIADAGLGAPVRLLLAATMRPQPEGELGAALGRVQREEICHTLRVGGLAEGESAELVRALGLERSSRQLISTVHGTTHGNPLHIEAVVQQAAGSGALHDRGGELVVDPAVVASAPPSDISAALDARIDDLSDRAREVLTLAAFLDDPVSPGFVAELAGAADVAGAIAEAVDAGVVSSDTDEVRFAHPLFAHLLRQRPDATQRRAIHLDAADVLERAADIDESVRVHEVAHHLIEADPVAPPDRVLEWARRAGDRSWSILAWGDAARCYETAGRAAEDVGAPAVEIAHLHFRAGVAHYRAMAFGPSSELLQRAARFSAIGDDARGVALARLERVRADIMTSGFGAAVDIAPLEAALDALTDDPALAGRLLTQIAEAHWVRGDIDEGRKLAARALELAREADDDATCVRALVTSAVVAWLRLDLDDALELLLEGRERADRSDDPWVGVIVLPRLALTLLWVGRLAEAEAVAAEASDTCRELGDWAERSLALSALVGVAAARGDFEAVERWAGDAWTAVRLSRYVWSASLFLPTLAATRALRGSTDEAAWALDRLADVQGSDTMAVFEEGVWLARQLVRVYTGEVDEAHTELTAHPERVSARWPVALGTVSRFAVLAELADAEAVDVPLDRIERGLARAAARGMTVTDGLPFVIPRVRALAARLDGRMDDAEGLLRDAVTLCEQTGARPELARASLEWARVRLADGDSVGAEPLAARAAGLFRELAMPAFALAADAVVREARGESAPDLRGRGAVVVAFFDVAGSTATNERIGDRAYRAAAVGVEANLRSAVADHGGQAIEGITLGDGVLAVFGSARDAIACAKRVHADATATPLRLHAGVHAGDVLWSEAGVHGGTVNIAARVCDRAGAGETFVTDTVRHLARTSVEVRFGDRGLHELKGLIEPIRLYAVET
jgi:class 3 adenylate cyclase